ARVEKIESNTRTGLTAIFITLVEGVKDVGKEFDDIKLKLDAIDALPEGAGPIVFVKDFGDTAALMLTVASPKTGALDIDLRSRRLQDAIERTRTHTPEPSVTIAHVRPSAIPASAARPAIDRFVAAATDEGVLHDP